VNDTHAWSNEADSQFERIDGVCDRFENIWNTGSRPRLETFLDGVAEADRTALLRELLALELHYRRTAGEVPTAEEYLLRFPHHDELIAIAFTSPVQPSMARAVEPISNEGGLSRRVLPTVTGYQILSELGRGGMGVVYKAHHLKLNRTVALKMILGAGHVGPEGLARFRKEAEATARLQHPHIVQIHEIGEADDLPYFALEFVGGGSLAKKLDGKPQPPREVARMVELLARAVAYAHESGIVHRDLKPGNVLLNAKGEPKIADFGLAKMSDAGEPITMSGAVMGTPSYMAPEQARGDTKNIGAAADIYTLGVMLFELLTGRLPFTGENTAALLRKVEGEQPPSLRGLCPRVPRDLEAICLMCLEKNPADRYSAATALADDLANYQAQNPLSFARPLGPAGRFWRRCRRNPVAAGLSLFVCLMAVCSLGFAVLTRDNSLRSVQRTGILRVGLDPDGAPYAFKRDGELTGLDVELARSLASRLGVHAQFDERDWNWPDMVKQLERREYDVLISVVTITEERKRRVAFIEYVRDPLVFTSVRGSIIRTRQDLGGKTIAVQEGTTAQESAERLQREGVGFTKIIPYRRTFEPFDAIRTGNADLTLDHQLIARHACRDGRLVVLGPVGQVLDPEPLGIVLRNDAQALREAIEQALTAMKADGEYSRLLGKWGGD